MLSGCRAVLEIGCGDGIGTPIVAQYVEKVVAIDIDGELIRSNSERLSMIKNINFRERDMCREQVEGTYDAAFSIDVLEHINTKQEDAYMRHTVHCLTKNGICIIGTPNITADVYASVSSRGYHVNLKSQETLRQLLHGYFLNVFMFSMNDEVVHTGFGPMAHYLFGMGVGVR
jgi:2-polyprenyl-3-methyl-5-hydroxy-6-metoxy-1,4-benzoquinol methylase